jgi:hypothetical protein
MVESGSKSSAHFDRTNGDASQRGLRERAGEVLANEKQLRIFLDLKQRAVRRDGLFVQPKLLQTADLVAASRRATLLGIEAGFVLEQVGDEIRRSDTTSRRSRLPRSSSDKSADLRRVLSLREGYAPPLPKKV